MSSRRAHLAALGLAAAAAPLIPGAASARAAPSRAPIELSAKRTKITLPDVPTLGLTYIALLDLFDSAGATVGLASTSSFVVDVTPKGPVVLGFIVLSLSDGEIHYQRLLHRYGDYPRTAKGAVTGGTGSYAAATGHVDVSWPDAERVELVVHLS